MHGWPDMESWVAHLSAADSFRSEWNMVYVLPLGLQEAVRLGEDVGMPYTWEQHHRATSSSFHRRTQQLGNSATCM
ncbi:hypothetical protein PG997_002789 [Apiospora hydei]|uniref:Uncharacterized protein n=1 Tax=Apiospora hydei TaxID=1337664 RepID=A0ABR1WXG3_9PEZI